MSNQIEREFDMPKDSVRLNKFLSEAGVCSRREADRLIESGRVTVDGRRAEMGMRVTKDQEVCVGKKIIQKKDRMVLLAVNKPTGIVCTEEKREKKNIIRFLNYPTRITYIGRLDTRPCKVEKIGKYKFRIILTQGLNRQIRRMCEYFGYQVTRLERIRVMNIELGNLKSGEYREVTGRELDELYELLKDSSNNTVYEE